MRASLLATKLGVASSNTAKAQGDIQAALGEDDAPSVHAEDVMHSSHETADLTLVAALTAAALAAIAGPSASASRSPTMPTAATGWPAVAARRASACCRSATAPGHAIATALRAAVASAGGHRDARPRAAPGACSRPRRAGARRSAGATATASRVDAGAVVLAAGGRCFAEAKRLGTFSTNAAGATGEVTEIARAAGCEARDLDALQYHPNGGLWPTTMQGYSIPETTRAYGALLLNAAGERFVDELGGRDVVAAAIVRECDEGRGLTTPEGRPVGAARLPPDDLLGETGWRKVVGQSSHACSLGEGLYRVL